MNKKGQEEIAGFVVIVAVIVVVLLVLLVIFLRTGERDLRQESREIYHFMESVMEYTTSCTSLSYQPEFFTVREVLRECRAKRTCTSGISACDLLNSTLSDILDKSWKVGPDRPYSGYEFKATVNTNLTSEEVISLSAGNCTGLFRGADYLTPPIVSSFNLCYS